MFIFSNQFLNLSEKIKKIKRVKKNSISEKIVNKHSSNNKTSVGGRSNNKTSVGGRSMGGKFSRIFKQKIKVKNNSQKVITRQQEETGIKYIFPLRIATFDYWNFSLWDHSEKKLESKIYGGGSSQSLDNLKNSFILESPDCRWTCIYRHHEANQHQYSSRKEFFQSVAIINNDVTNNGDSSVMVVDLSRRTEGKKDKVVVTATIDNDCLEIYSFSPTGVDDVGDNGKTEEKYTIHFETMMNESLRMKEKNKKNKGKNKRENVQPKFETIVILPTVSTKATKVSEAGEEDRKKRITIFQLLRDKEGKEEKEEEKKGKIIVVAKQKVGSEVELGYGREVYMEHHFKMFRLFDDKELVSNGSYGGKYNHCFATYQHIPVVMSNDPIADCVTSFTFTNDESWLTPSLQETVTIGVCSAVRTPPIEIAPGSFILFGNYLYQVDFFFPSLTPDQSPLQSSRKTSITWKIYKHDIPSHFMNSCGLVILPIRKKDREIVQKLLTESTNLPPPLVNIVIEYVGRHFPLVDEEKSLQYLERSTYRSPCY